MKTDIEFGSYKFINFCNLDTEQIAIVLSERNKYGVRRWMNNNNEIEYQEHIEFVDSLVSTDDKYYWLVLRKNKPIGVIYIVDINNIEKSGTWGYYLFEKYQGAGWGIDVQFYALSIFFNYLNLDDIFGYVNNDNINSITIQPIFNFEIRGYEGKQVIFGLKRENFIYQPSEIKKFKLEQIINHGKFKNYH